MNGAEDAIHVLYVEDDPAVCDPTRPPSNEPSSGPSRTARPPNWTRVIAADGNTRWVHRREQVVPDADGQVVCGYIQDITEANELVRELERTAAQLETAIEAGAGGTWEWHVPGNRLVVGQEFARRFGSYNRWRTVDRADGSRGVRPVEHRVAG
jgi:PAS domain-containing protein